MRYRLLSVFALCFMILAVVHPAMAEKFKPVVLYQGSIPGNSFNQAIHDGVERFTATTGVPCREVVVENPMEAYMSALDKLCAEGFSPIFLVYGNHVKGLPAYVRAHPQIRFLVMGAVIDEPNALSFDLAEQEGSFLAGALAAMVSKSGVIGFVSVSDLPLMRRFSCGYEQGARYVVPDIKVLVGFTGSYEDAWFDGNATAAMADELMDQGADVIYQAAGGAGPAVLEACAKRGKLGIGVDLNQNGLYPGHVLTSMLKRSDQVVYAALLHAQKGIWRDNIKKFGVAQNAVGLAFDDNNKNLVTDEMKARIREMKNKISLGEIKVHDYVIDNMCP